MPRKKFTAKLEAGGEGDAWTILRIPFSVEEVFGSKGRVSVKGTINGFAYRSSIFSSGDGKHEMLINKAMQKGANVGPGDTVRVEMEPDTEPREVAIPSDLQQALSRNPQAKVGFEKMSPSRKKLLVESIEGAKKAETRAKRISIALETLSDAGA
jgi:Domain of unknown function (DUF1905)/Bacteriocin-protection, YdeI or OmpD-Associated